MQKIETHILCYTAFPENRTVYDSVKKCGGATGATNDVTIWRIRVGCRISKATRTHTPTHPDTNTHAHFRAHIHTHRHLLRYTTVASKDPVATHWPQAAHPRQQECEQRRGQGRDDGYEARYSKRAYIHLTFAGSWDLFETSETERFTSKIYSFSCIRLRLQLHHTVLFFRLVKT